jgi:hypothetical protein
MEQKQHMQQRQRENGVEERPRGEMGLRLVSAPEQPREDIDPRDSFPWRGLAAAVAVWLALALALAAF